MVDPRWSVPALALVLVATLADGDALGLANGTPVETAPGLSNSPLYSSCSSTERQPSLCAWENLTASGTGGYYECTDSEGNNQFTTGPVYSNVSLVARAWGGTPPYNFSWNFFGDGKSANGSQTYEKFNQPFPPGIVNVTVRDARGSVSSTLIFYPIPSQPRASCPVFGLSLLLWGVIVIVVVVSAVVVTLVIIRRKRKLPTHYPPS